MKLKEKLAVTYLASQESWGGLCKKEMEIHIAGFEKAREMAQKRFVDKIMVRPKDKRDPFTLNTVIVNGDHFEFTILEDFQNLGEEEVE